MPNRTLQDIFDNDTLSLLDVSVSKSTRLTEESIWFSILNEVTQFKRANGYLPSPNSQAIHEAKLGTRFQNILSKPDLIETLRPYDTDLLLPSTEVVESTPSGPSSIESLFSSSLLAVDDPIFQINPLYEMTTKSQSTNENMAKRKPCKDFATFKPIFVAIQHDLNADIRKTEPISKIAEIKAGQAFILSGLIAYVAEVGEKYEHRKGHHNAKTRIIFSNGMESDLLLRSFGAALYKDSSARAITGESLGPLFRGIDDEKVTGYVYVLRSLSTNPEIYKHRHYLHKIGVTKTTVKNRISHAAKDPTYLLADVEIVAEFALYNFNPHVTEQLLHKFFQTAQADLCIKDRFGNDVKPREWFFIPFDEIRKAVSYISDNTILDYVYDFVEAKIVKANKLN